MADEKPKRSSPAAPNGTLRALALVEGAVLWYSAQARVSLRAVRGADGAAADPPRTIVRLGDSNPDGYLVEGDVAEVAASLGLGF